MYSIIPLPPAAPPAAAAPPAPPPPSSPPPPPSCRYLTSCYSPVRPRCSLKLRTLYSSAFSLSLSLSLSLLIVCLPSFPPLKKNPLSTPYLSPTFSSFLFFLLFTSFLPALRFPSLFLLFCSLPSFLSCTSFVTLQDTTASVEALSWTVWCLDGRQARPRLCS